MTFNEQNARRCATGGSACRSASARMVGAMGVTFVVMVTLIVGFLITDGLSSMEERNADMRQALRDLDTQRDNYLRMKAKTAQMETRLGSTPVQLQGYLEAAAKEAGVEIPESDRAAGGAGGQEVRRAHRRPAPARGHARAADASS